MDSCRELFKTMEILPFYSQQTFSLLWYVVINKHLFTKSITMTLDPLIIYLPITNLTKYQKAHYAGIKMFNELSTHKKCVANEIQDFKSVLKRFLLSNLFYSIGEYFNSNE